MGRLKISHILMPILIAGGAAAAGHAQDVGRAAPTLVPASDRLMWRMGDKDLVLPLSAVEWGVPDRWSFTTVYMHKFDDGRDSRSWHHAITLPVSPGTDGGRVGFGWLCVYSPPSMKEDIALIGELRAVLVRTWRRPLVAAAGRNYAGLELSTGLGWVHARAGWYKGIPREGPGRDSFYGLHIGVGI